MVTSSYVTAHATPRVFESLANFYDFWWVMPDDERNLMKLRQETITIRNKMLYFVKFYRGKK